MLNKFEEIEFVLVRAAEDVEWLRQNVRHPDLDRVPQNRGWVLQESFDIFTTNIRLHIGDLAARLRSALNYFTCILAEQDSNCVGKQVQFPIEHAKEEFWGKRDRFLKGISDEHVAAIEIYQPYNAGDWITDLQKFSNWYRHSGLVKAQKVFQEPERFPSPSDAYRIGPSVVQVQRGFFIAVSLEDGRPVVQTLEEIHRRVGEAINNLKPTIQKYLSDFI